MRVGRVPTGHGVTDGVVSPRSSALACLRRRQQLTQHPVRTRTTWNGARSMISTAACSCERRLEHARWRHLAAPRTQQHRFGMHLCVLVPLLRCDPLCTAQLQPFGRLWHTNTRHRLLATVCTCSAAMGVTAGWMTAGSSTSVRELACRWSRDARRSLLHAGGMCTLARRWYSRDPLPRNPGVAEHRVPVGVTWCAGEQRRRRARPFVVSVRRLQRL